MELWLRKGYKSCPGGRGGGGGGGGRLGLGLSVCEWYKSCPVGTTNHILGGCGR